MRTEERFHAGFTSALSTLDDPQARCVAGARYTVQWCREHPVEGHVLLAGADALCLADWPEELTARRRRLHRKLRRLLADLPADGHRVTAVLIDIPYAVVRRHLFARRAIPASADAIVSDCARALISAG